MWITLVRKTPKNKVKKGENAYVKESVDNSGGGRLISLILSCIFLLGGFLVIYFTVIKPATDSGAFSTKHTTYKQVGELLLDPTDATAENPFNLANITELVNMIYGSAGDVNTQITNLKNQVSSTPLTATDLRNKTYNKSSGQSIVVHLGGLDWIVTYISNDTSGNLTATLWLSNNHQEAWKDITHQNIGKYCAIVNGGLYSDWSADWWDNSTGTYPSNMYGTSYVRVEALNNPYNRRYATSVSALSSKVNQTTSLLSYGSGHPFALYTVSSYGLTNYLTTPSKMKWMNEFQSTKTTVGYDSSNNSLYNQTDKGSWYGSGQYNYAGKSGYTNWDSDYLFLPSMVETGYSGDSAGLWQTNTTERTTYDGSTYSISASSSIGTANVSHDSTKAISHSLTRTAYMSYASTNYNLAYAGSGFEYEYMDYSQAVRPVLLLNLNSAISHSTPVADIIFDKQGGTGGSSTISVAEGDTLPTITPPTKTGYKFGGYYTETNGSGTKIYNADGTPAISTSTFTQNTTLYAYWMPNWVTFRVSIDSSTSEFSIKSYLEATGINGKLNIIPESGHYVSSFSFDNVTWYEVTHYKYEIFDSDIALCITYFASTSNNGFGIDFEMLNSQKLAETIKVYLKTTSTPPTSLKKPSGGVEGVAIKSTYGGVARILGADLDSMGDDDIIICSADMAIDGYKFLHWIDEAGNILSTDQSVKFTKKEVMDTVITAVFAPIDSSNINLDTNN